MEFIILCHSYDERYYETKLILILFFKIHVLDEQNSFPNSPKNLDKKYFIIGV